MNNYRTIFKPEKLDTLVKANVAIASVYKELCEGVLAGQDCNLEYADYCFRMLDDAVQLIWDCPEIEAEFEMYDPLYNNFIYNNCKHHLEVRTEKQKKLIIKTNEICIILTLFDYFVKHRSKNKITLKAVQVKRKFRPNFIEWYRDSDGNPSDDSSIRGYLKKFLTDFDIDNDLYVLKINSYKEEIINFFARNDVKNFKSGHSDITNLFESFYDDVMKITSY